MVRLSLSLRALFRFVLLAVVAFAPKLAYAEWFGDKPEHDRPPVYQRRAFESSRWHGKGRHYPHHRVQYFAPQVSSGWFQRPYPYHLDYYRMKYGGSYAPYFGNLYGPPQVVTAPPYYGPYYGGYGDPGAYGSDGAYNAVPILPPNGVTESPPGNDDATLPGNP